VSTLPLFFFDKVETRTRSSAAAGGEGFTHETIERAESWSSAREQNKGAVPRGLIQVLSARPWLHDGDRGRRWLERR